MKVDHNCQTCGEDAETINHMMFCCRVSKEIWTMAPTPFEVLDDTPNPFIQNLNVLIHMVGHILQVIHGAIRV